MKTRTYLPEQMSREFICLGKRGESNHLALCFDVALWREAHPSAEFVLFVTPPEGASYSAVIEEKDGDVIWTVTEADTVHAGDGLIELILRDTGTNTTIKSETAHTIIKCSPSASGAEGGPPAPHAPWWQKVLDALASIEEQVEADGLGILLETGFVEPTTNGNNEMYTDNDGVIYVM